MTGVLGLAGTRISAGKGERLQMRLVHEQMLVEDGGSTGGPLLRATAKNMARGATKHAAAETQRVAALKVGE